MALTPKKQKQSIFPDFPRGMPTVKADGNFTENWHLGFSTLFQQLQKNITNEGIQVPQLVVEDIDQIAAIYAPLVGKTLGTAPNISGKIVYDISNQVLKVFIIVFATATDPSSEISSADWKTITMS